MDPKYRLLNAILLILATALISSAPSIAVLIPQSGLWAWVSVIFGMIIVFLREYVKEQGQAVPEVQSEPPQEQ